MFPETFNIKQQIDKPHISGNMGQTKRQTRIAHSG